MKANPTSTKEWKLSLPAGFNVIATANTKGRGSDDGKFMGAQILDEAFLERFAITVEQEYPSAVQEKKIIINKMTVANCVDEDFADKLVTLADVIRKTFYEGGIDELVSTRRLEHIVKAFACLVIDSRRFSCVSTDSILTQSRVH